MRNKLVTLLLCFICVFSFAQDNATEFRLKNTFVDAKKLADLYQNLLNSATDHEKKKHYQDSIYTKLLSYDWYYKTGTGLITGRYDQEFALAEASH